MNKTLMFLRAVGGRFDIDRSLEVSSAYQWEHRRTDSDP